MKKGIILEVIISMIILLFAYTGLSKLVEFRKFNIQLSISPFELLRNNAAIVAWGIPILELLIVGLLLIGRTRLLGLYATFFLMVSFTVYILTMLAAKVDLPCTCGGVITSMSWTQHLFFNIFFVIITLIGILIMRNIIKGREFKMFPEKKFSL